MKEKKHYAGVVFIPLLFIILYIIFAARVLTTEFRLKPQWTVDAEQTIAQTSKEKVYPFKYKGKIGYFTENGSISVKNDYSYKAAISENYWSDYSVDSQSITVYDSSSKPVCVINEYGFPFFEQDRIYMFIPGGNSVAQYDVTGTQIFLRESYAPITAFASSQGGTACGFADGRVMVMDSKGITRQDFVPDGSATNVIYGIGISDDGNTAAFVTGLDQQRFCVSVQEGDHSKIIHSEFLEKELTRETLVKFHGNTVYFNYNGGLGIYNIDRKKSYRYELPGKIQQIEFSSESKLAFVLSKDAGVYTVTMLEPHNHCAGSFSFSAESAFIRVDGKQLFIGQGSKISKYTVSRK